jgi:hypothetical protein
VAQLPGELKELWAEVFTLGENTLSRLLFRMHARRNRTSPAIELALAALAF